MTVTPAITRFAPSPTGRLHLGNARTALFSYLLAHAAAGRFLLRIEDTDAIRSEASHEADLMEDLRWLGLAWDAGPDREAPEGPFRQSERGAVYAAQLDRLVNGGHAYPCFCTVGELEAERAAQRAAGRPPRYSGRCAALAAAEVARRVAAGEAHTLRFRMPARATLDFDDLVRGRQQFRAADIGDFVIRRADGSPAFFFSNAVDDALMGVTHVLRGEDHISNTPRQIALLRALDLPVPRYGHLPLVVGEDAQPLSKRSDSLALGALRAAGYLPLAVVNHLARLGHYYEDNALAPLPALARAFDLARVGRAPAQHDAARLTAWQREALGALDMAALLAWAAPALGPVPAAEQPAFLQAVRDNVWLTEDVEYWVRAVYGEPLALEGPARGAVEQAGGAFFAAAAELLDTHGTDFKALAAALKARTGRKGKGLFQPLRAALTGTLEGPELAALLPLIGTARAGARFAAWCDQED
ncbi:glutamate--tRNA ligase [Ectothiorhodospiraceae bacterium 2226]|nr:glutamate--tRNA ligase [Ectothiorhodospiraceae bacterium 2226]